MIPLVFAAVAAVAGFTGAWQIQAMRNDAAITALKNDYLKRDFRALENAHAETLSLQARKDEAERKARVREAALARDIAANRDVVDGLRDELAASSRALPDASCASVRQHAATLNTVFGECAASVERLAGQAQGHAIDSLKLQESWPK